MTQAGLSPNYSVKFYRDGFYKLIRFNRSLVPRLPDDSDIVGEKEKAETSGKFSQALSRARSVVFQVALCNDWQYFFTGTIDRTKFDRYDLRVFYKSFSQWIRDQNKKYGIKIQYLFIPERHKDGAWHIHGLVRGLPDCLLSPFVRGLHPLALVEHGFLNWSGFEHKFGFCSLAPLRDVIGVAWYVTKYITKDMEQSVSDFGAHTYRCSIGLARAVPLGSIFGRYPELDSRLTHHSEFCATGFVSDVTWDFWLPYLPVSEQLVPVEYPEDEIPVLTNVDVKDYQLSLYDLISDFAG